MPHHLTVTTTVADRDLAEFLARSAVDLRLAACAQIDGPVTSIYRWDGAVQEEPEWRVSFKTPTERFDALRDHIVSTHPYQVPEIVAVGLVDGNPGYLTWLDDETSGARSEAG